MQNKCKKIKYINELEAKQNLERMKNDSGHKRTEKRAYRCNECGMWHLTSKNNKGLPIDTIEYLAREVMKLKNFGYDVTSTHPQLNSPIRRVTISGETWRAYDLNVVRNSWHYIRTKERGYYKDAVSFILKVLPID